MIQNQSESVPTLETVKQTNDDNEYAYKEKMNAAYDIFETHIGAAKLLIPLAEKDDKYVGEDEIISKVLDTTSLKDDEKKAAIKEYQDILKKNSEVMNKLMEEFLAYLYISNSNELKYGSYKKELDNDYSKGMDNYAKTVEDSCERLRRRPKDATWHEYVKKNRTKKAE